MPDYSDAILPQLLSRKSALLPGTDRIVLPESAGRSLSSIPGTVSKLLGGPELPCPPLSRELLGKFDGRYRNVIVLLVDALGYDHLQRLMATGKAEFWRENLERASLFPLTSICPSTTATALTTLWTGVEPAEHGYIGYELWLKRYGMVVNTILHMPASYFGDIGSLGKSGFVPESFLGLRQLGAQFADRGIESHAFLPYSIGGSGLSRMHLEKTNVHGYVAESDMWANLRDILNTPARGARFLYVYWSTLDTLIHRYGPNDERVGNQFSDLSRSLAVNLLGGLEKSVREKSLLLLTADHGALATPPEENYDLRNHPELMNMLRMLPTCEARLPFLFLKPGQEAGVRAYFANAWPGQFILLSMEEVLSLRLFGTGREHPELRDRVGDLVAVPTGDAYLWWPEKPNLMQGRHGGLDRSEMLIPLYALPLG
ncbi:MAG: alkaline phosphatase family protein [Anaerolineaceae bacterium]